ncbi:lipoprotein [Staphylococcus schweitzeri]|uniref:Lipoprotein n=2 Tax=Staphylococcus schweitzeri TaxID=1654388 RepID=A0A077UJP5_9STAP|nr:lipoprotein [Staphylococcus schweitzeri]
MIMNKINDRDLTEIGGYWVYQDLKDNSTIKVNGNKYKVLSTISNNKNKNINGSADIKIFELLDSNNSPSGQQIISFEGTNNNESINPKNPFKGKVGDDWLENIKLMDNENTTTPLLEQNNKFLESYKKKLDDANKLSKSNFYRKYGEKVDKYKNKEVVSEDGNSQGGASAIHQGVEHPEKRIVSSNPAMLPEAIWRDLKQSNFKNIINFHSTNDLLSWLQDPFAKEMPGKRINIRDGVPTLNGLIDSHLGFKREFNSKTNEYKDIPVHKIESVKDTEIKNGKEVKKVININLDMDGRIPINVWTGDSIARSGKGKNIKLDIEKLGDLYQLVTGETSIMLQECVTFLNESFNISQSENSYFGDRKHKLKQKFKNVIEIDVLENMSRDITSKKNELFESIDSFMDKIGPIAILVPALNLKPLKWGINKVDSQLQSGIERIHDSIDKILVKMFKNLDHDLQDGVTEEMMKHLKIVSENIVLIKNQNDIYGNQIADIKSIMSYQDATVMDGNLNINYSGQHMVSGKVKSSKYLSRKMTILKNHIDNAVKELSDYIQKVYNDNFKELVRYLNHTIEIIKGIIDGLNLLITMIYEKRIIDGLKEASIDRKQFENSIEELKINLTKWTDFLHDLKAASPILENHLDDIIKNMKPLIVNQIFEPSHYDDMFILNTQAHARLDQMAQQFEVVCNGLNENEGQAIQTMDQSASLIHSNLIQVKEQLEKLAVY